MKVVTKFSLKIVTVVAIVVLLGGCKPVLDFFKRQPSSLGKAKKSLSLTQKKDKKTKKEDKGVVLLNIDGKPAISESDFNQHLTQMLQVNPYFRGASVDSLPAPLKRKFFDELVKQELIIAWADKNNIDKDEKFQQSFENMKKLVRRSLLVQQFESNLFEDIKISEKDIIDYYNKNKDKFVKEPGGTLIEAIFFDDDTAATNFYNKVKGKESEFKSLARLENKDAFKSFGRIDNNKAGLGVKVPEKIKEKALSFKELPAIGKCQDNGKTWVFCAVDKTPAKYFDLEEIKDQLEGMLKNNKFRDMLNEKVEALKSDFTLDINEDYFQSPVEEMQKDNKKDNNKKKKEYDKKEHVQVSM